MEVPYTMKIHAIIEKTALFVSEQGGQMEIIIKMKQQGNPQFAFMHLDNPLYPYYKHLVKVIKSGAYKPVPARKVSRSEDEDDDEHYLHPSLMSGRQEPVPKFTVPTINFRRSHDDSYSVLVRNLQQHRKEETASPQPESEQNSNEGSANTSSTSDEESNDLKNTATSSILQIIPPPPDLQPIIDKMAEYVAKNGEDFETIVKSKNDKRFDFLHTWHEFHNYYIHKRNHIKTTMHTQNPSVGENAAYESGTSNIPYQYQMKPIVQESGPVLYKNGQPADKPPKQSTKPISPVVVAAVTVKEECDALSSQDSQDAFLEQHSKSIEAPKDDTSNSMDFLDSPKCDKSSEEEANKSKPPKVLKGPISFSLKSKEAEAPSEKAKLTPLLMDDSEEESSEENKSEKDASSKRRKSVDESCQANTTKTNSVDVEVKAPKQNSEVLEAKQAEERIKDKLLSAARERLAQQKKEKQMLLEQQKREEQLKKERQQLLDQQRKEKQLQLERKRKAELFLKMLKKKNPDSKAVVSHILASDKVSSGSKPSDFWSLPDTSTIGPPTGAGILFHGNKMLLSTTPGIPTLKTDWSSDSVSEHSGEEEPISVIGEKLSSEEPDAPEEATVPKPEKKKKKRKHSSRSRSREHSSSKRSKTSHRSREKRRSPSRSHKQEKKKEKQLPAAYALSTRSRSRSRSPRSRYRPSFNHWNRRR